MAVVGSVVPVLRPIPGEDRFWRWNGLVYVTGDATGGAVTMDITFENISVFGGKWLFNVDFFSIDVWGTVGAGYTGGLYIGTMERSNSASQFLVYRRFVNIYNIDSMGGVDGRNDSPAHRILFKPNYVGIAGSTPFVRGVVNTNANAIDYQFSAGGFIVDERYYGDFLGLTRQPRA